ncbi:MAG: biopolymer transporter ExbD [Candidatus Omnitrophica bacterium]|nr:biopolymer transporter ExbD [Candidatus Omnitrophota bacterium]
MRFTNENDTGGQRPSVQMAPLIDIVFLLLIFFMAASVFYQLETEMDIAVPEAAESSEMKRSPGEIIVNITREGKIIVNGRRLGQEDLKKMLTRISRLYSGQPVIIRADRRTYHKDVIQVLDICAGAGIWNVSFATMKEDRED